MRVSKNWLKEYLNIADYTDAKLSSLFNAHVCEIETYTKMVEASNLTIGYVKECIDHPDSDHLHVCQVEIRPGEVSQIICGAPNICQGAKVIVALPGAVLPGNFKIKVSKIRGVESNGMICSLQELGIEDKYIPEEYADGIYMLENDAPIGEDPLAYLGLDDAIIELNVTANRSDLLSIEGVSYDLGAALRQPITPIQPKKYVGTGINDISIMVETKKCNQYNTRLLTNVKIKSSPLWMRQKLIASGIRPINIVVDITNYVLMELGQPLHSFDADKLGKKIVVRQAKANEKLITLDGIERVLEPTDIVISNGDEALCLGGVMGGLSTEVLNSTTNVLLEAAAFDPLNIRKTSSRLGLKSESSTRFERKIDETRTLRALNRATELLVEFAGASVVGEISSTVGEPYKENFVKIATKDINHVLGTNLTDFEVEMYFTVLAFVYTKQADEYIVTLPARRMDLEPTQQHIIEDIARMYGYDTIPTTLARTNARGGLTVAQKRIRSIRHLLSAQGLNETVSYSLVHKDNVFAFTMEENDPVEILMPLTEDRAVMRQSVLNGVVEAIQYNRARKQSDVAFFEIGNRYFKDREERVLAIGMSGVFEANLWAMKKHVTDFYTIKGIIEDLASHLDLTFKFEASTTLNENLHPGRCAKIYFMEECIGYVSALHPKYAQEHHLGDTYVAEICLEKILAQSSRHIYTPLNKYPSIERDLAIVCKKDIPADRICEVIRNTAKKMLTHLQVFDVYMGENVKEDEKSLAITLVFEDTTKTLETADVDKVVRSILNRLEFHYQARLR